MPIFFKPPLEPGTVLYEAELTQFAEDIRKWKDRYIVVKNDFAVESYENREVRHLHVTPGSHTIHKPLARPMGVSSPLLLIRARSTCSGIISINGYLLNFYSVPSVMQGSS